MRFYFGNTNQYCASFDTHTHRAFSVAGDNVGYFCVHLHSETIGKFDSLRRFFDCPRDKNGPATVKIRLLAARVQTNPYISINIIIR